MKTKKTDQQEEEDSIVIANMNVEGMPWYHEDKPVKSGLEPREVPDKKQTFYMILGALKAALLIIIVFSIALVLFTLLCTKVWLN